jgi:Cu-Zn family superoxide dismutase
MKKVLMTALLAGVMTTAYAADDIVVDMKFATEQGPGESAGTVTITQTEFGAKFSPDIKGLEEPGVRGFHVHEVGSCDATEADGKVTPAGAAAGHWDPEETGSHKGPWADGHKGDLPALYVDPEGSINYPVVAPRISDINELRGLALMIHVGGDNYSDDPLPLGGGGARNLCGVIK